MRICSIKCEFANLKNLCGLDKSLPIRYGIAGCDDSYHSSFLWPAYVLVGNGWFRLAVRGGLTESRHPVINGCLMCVEGEIISV